jgi:DNA-binding response OmpR family regulator
MTGAGSGARDAVLVADDSMTVLSMVTARLERSGFDVVSATDGEEALRLARELHPRLAVLDLDMPGLTGIQVTRHLRQDPALAGMRIVLLTGHGSEEDVAAGFAAGADDYIVKPFSPQDLQRRIEQLLGLA